LSRIARGTSRSLRRGLQVTLWLLLLIDLIALPLHASVHGPGEPLPAGHGWHAGQDRLHIEPDEGHPGAELLDHSALRPANSIRPAANPSDSRARAEGDDPGEAFTAVTAQAAAAATLIALLAALGLVGPPTGPVPLTGRAPRWPLPAQGRTRPWDGLCPPRQAPPSA